MVHSGVITANAAVIGLAIRSIVTLGQEVKQFEN
jgi:hypothetical protein